MNVRSVSIGNSKGIRIPKRVLDQCQIEDSVDLVVDGESIVLRPVKKKVREGWGEASKRMNQAGDDELLLPALEGLSNGS